MILMIDDEKRTLDSYLDELQMSKFQVRSELSADAGFRFMEEHANELKLLILDVMMPSGGSFNEEETERGLTTGVRFYERVRASNEQLPIIILTNRVDAGIRRFFEKDPHCRFFEKEELLPFELADVVRDVIKENN